MTEEIKFKVGEKYENMKGIFEVIAMKRDTMDIRWDDGEQISTSIDLQRRIIERMRYEEELIVAEALQKEKKAKAAAARKAKAFSGLGDSDFSSTISKTTWRGRGQLGGAVARLIKDNRFTFNSWAVLRKPEVNWLDTRRQKQEDLKIQAKFHARIEDDKLLYGLLVPATDPAKHEKSDWQSLMDWLENAENEAWLTQQCQNHGLSLNDPTGKGFVGELVAENEQWVQQGSDQESTAVASVSSFLRDAGKAGTMDLRIEKQLDKATVIEKKQHIAEDLASLFETLMPMYTAAAGS